MGDVLLGVKLKFHETNQPKYLYLAQLDYRNLHALCCFTIDTADSSSFGTVNGLPRDAQNYEEIRRK